MERIGLLGGTFDPVHLGHLNLAIEMQEKRGLDEVWFCPAKENPFKQNQPTLATSEQRVEMCKLALQDYLPCKVLDLELKREGPSFTIDTLRELKVLHSDMEFFLIIGEDAAKEFHRWHLADEIVSLVSILVGCRAENRITFEGSSEIVNALKKGATETKMMDISSTEIRKRLQKGLFCGHLVLQKVLDYIFQNQLYLDQTENT